MKNPPRWALDFEAHTRVQMLTDAARAHIHRSAESLDSPVCIVWGQLCKFTCRGWHWLGRKIDCGGPVLGCLPFMRLELHVEALGQRLTTDFFNSVASVCFVGLFTLHE